MTTHYTWSFKDSRGRDEFGIYTVCGENCDEVSVSTNLKVTTCPRCLHSKRYLEDLAQSMENALAGGLQPN